MLAQLRIVMVETTHPGNIGAAARAMKTMGLSDLRLISPKHFPSDEATARASGAGSILEHAQVVSSLDEAIGDADLVIGTSARQRRIPWPCVTPRQLAAQVQADLSDNPALKIAILFGREARGLTNEELQRCNLHVSIPPDDEYGVLNVAAAVQLLSYEMRLALVGEGLELEASRSRRFQMSLPELVWDEPQASNQELNRLLEHLLEVAVQSGFLNPQNPAQVETRLRRLFMRARPDRMEVSILRGILSSVQRKMDKPD